MNIQPRDTEILRELAGNCAEIAALPVQKQTAGLWKKLNSLRSDRPMVHIYQMPWSEIEETEEFLKPRCQDEFCRNVESRLRQTIYQWKHVPGDMVVEPEFLIAPAISGFDFGITVLARTIKAEAISAVSSHEYEIQIRDESDIEKIRMPEIVHDSNATAERVAALDEAFAGALKVKAGLNFGWFNIAPWDQLVQYTGVQEILMDLALRPEYVHRLMDRFTRAYERRLDQFERLHLLALNNNSQTVGQGGLGFTDELPGPVYDPKHVRCANIWGGGMAQIFSEVSPEMHEEFALAYEKRCLDRFPLVYYGCCEPLHHKVDMIRRMLPKVRKISMSPWANVEQGAKALGSDIVFSYKPNPAHLAVETWNPDLVRSELRSVLTVTKAHGCHTELILKDISTVRHEPMRLWKWSEIARKAAEEFAR